MTKTVVIRVLLSVVGLFGVVVTLLASTDPSLTSVAWGSFGVYVAAFAALTLTFRQQIWGALRDPRPWAVLFVAFMMSLHSAPVNVDKLHWFSYLPMFWALRAEDPRANRWLGYLWGVAAFAIIYRWIAATITLFSSVPFDLAVVALIICSLVFGAMGLFIWPFLHPMRRRLGSWWVLVFPCLVVVVEWISMKVLLFPYNQGISQFRNPYTFQLASVTGVWGLTWLVFFTNSALAECVYRHREGREQNWIPVALAVGLVSAVTVFGAYRYDSLERQLREAPTLRVAQLQTGMTMVERLRMGPRAGFHAWMEMTRTIPKGSVDLVIWPEGGSPYPLNTGRAAGLIGQLAKAGEFEMVVGGGTQERVTDAQGDTRFTTYNTVYWFDKKGAVTERYHKQVPLPFGEYLPLANVFPWLRDLIQGPGQFGAGEEAVVADGVVRMAAPICYEAILGDVCRAFPDPDLLVNVTNDGWFGATDAPYQHAMLTAARSMELGVPMIRSAYTGISMVVEPHGNIYAETQPFTDVVRVISVRLHTVDTVYKRFGDWFVILCGLVLVAAGLLSPWRRRRALSESA